MAPLPARRGHLSQAPPSSRRGRADSPVPLVEAPLQENGFHLPDSGEVAGSQLRDEKAARASMSVVSRARSPEAASVDASATPVVRVHPRRGWQALELRELWRHHELLYFLAWRDVKVRYKQTLLGVAWVIIQPFITMVVFSIFFGHLAKVPSDGVPYPVFAFAALVPW